MRNLIAILKLMSFLLSTLFFYSLIVLGNTFSFFGVNKVRWSGKMRKRWAKSVSSILGMKVISKGTPPSTPFFLVSNHLSYVDVWVLYSLLHCTFIAKSEVKNWPIIGFILATSGVLFVNRGKRGDVARVNEEIARNLSSDQGIVLFPEGTTSAGVDILPFKSSLFEFPAQNNLPISCASIKYETPEEKEPAFNSICWWDDTPFFKHLFYLFVMKEFTATVTFSSETITNPNRKILASSSEAIIRKSFEPTVDRETYAEASISS